MRKVIGFIAISLLVLMGTPTLSMAGAKKGQRIFKKSFQKTCGFSGVSFARNHLQSEWDDIYTSGKFQEEAKNICPELNLEKIKKSAWEDVYEYSVMYAKDGVPPNGCDD